jgi:dipeptidyl aminopeptidase/acylaminoacyl peptidase
VISVIDIKKHKVFTCREGKKIQPNYYVRNLKTGKLKQITQFAHPFPRLKDVEKQFIKYKREDGIELNGSLYLPPGYKESDGPLPVLMWAYPREYKSKSAAGQVTDSPYRFIRLYWGSPILWITQGYAVFDNPKMPIVGEGEKEPNDTYVQQLVASAKAAIDKLVEMGIADRKRIAIGGHSYGAFMAANLLAHSRLFATGIARSGAYNRTLTPFGFQAEERTFWEAPDTYFKMSPFMHANKVKDPLLLIHGKADNNSGTFPIQSERFYHALKGHGATVRLVMLPFESHGYRARESIMHVAWETYNWLEKYVKNKK